MGIEPTSIDGHLQASSVIAIAEEIQWGESSRYTNRQILVPILLS